MTAPTHLHRRRWRLVSAPVPAAGANWVLTPGGGNAFRVVSLVAHFVASGVAGARQITLTAGTAERTWFMSPASATVAAGQAVDIAAHTGATAGGVVPGVLTVPLPTAGLLLRSGHSLRVTVTNQDVGDLWSAIVASVDEFTSSDHIVGDATDETPQDYRE